MKGSLLPYPLLFAKGKKGRDRTQKQFKKIEGGKVITLAKHITKFYAFPGVGYHHRRAKQFFTFRKVYKKKAPCSAAAALQPPTGNEVTAAAMQPFLLTAYPYFFHYFLPLAYFFAKGLLRSPYLLRKPFQRKAAKQPLTLLHFCQRQKEAGRNEKSSPCLLFCLTRGLLRWGRGRYIFLGQ